MIENMEKFLEVGGELSSEERNLVSIAYKNIVGSKRAEIRALTHIYHEEGNFQNE